MPRVHLPQSTRPGALLTVLAALSLPAVAQERIDVDSQRLLGELALADQRPQEAADHFLEAAMASEDPFYAERAAQTAYQFALDTVGHRAVARWRELDPENLRADYFAGIFETRSGRVDAAVNEFSDVLDTFPPSNVGSGFALILDGLANEPSANTAAQVMLELNRRFPDSPEGHYGLAQLALRAGAFDLALAESQTTIQLSPEWPEAQLLHARTLLLSGRSEEALAIASELADEYDNTALKLQFAELLLSSGETAEAERLLNEILEENPGMPEAIRALAFLSLANDDLDVAKERFEMLRSDPAYRDETFYYLGRIAELESDYLQAQRSYQRVTDGPRAVEAQIRTGAIYYEQMNDPESALRHLSEFGTANPRFAPEMLLAQAELLLRMDRAEEGIALIDNAIGSNPDIADENLKNAHIGFYSTLMQDAIDRGDLVAAETWIEDGLTRYPGDQSLRYSQAILLQEQDRLKQSVRVLEDLVEESPDHPVFLNALGYLLTDKFDNHEEARGYIQRALAMDPENGAILDSMGWVLYRLGEYELSLDYLERAYRVLEVTEVEAHLIDVHWALGDRELALRMLDEGLTRAPDDSYLNEVKSRLRP
jgi:tetratricopeptide (TPR) repeat protein